MEHENEFYYSNKQINRPEWRPDGFHGQLSHDIIYAEDWNAELNPKDHKEESEEEEEEKTK